MARWAELGAAGGKAIGDIAERHAHAKLLQMQGIPAKQSYYLAQLTPQQQEPYVQAAWGHQAQQPAPQQQSQPQQQPAQQQSSSLLSPLQNSQVAVSPVSQAPQQGVQGLSSQQAYQGQPAQLQDVLSKLLGGGLNGAPSPFISGPEQPNLLTAPLLKGLSQLQQYAGQGQQGPQFQIPQQQQSAFPSPEAPQVNAPQQMQQQQPQQVMPQGQQPIAAPQTIEQALANVGSTRTRDQLAAERFEHEKEKEKRVDKHQREVEERERYKLHKESIETRRKDAEKAQKQIVDFKVLKTLNKSDKLIQGKSQQLLKEVGLENFFTNPETEFAQKLIAEQALNATNDFNAGKRLTNFELESYQKTIGQLTNTKEGFDLILDNKILQAEAKVAYADAQKQLLDYYTNKKEPLPLNFEDIAADMASPKLKALGDKAMADAVKTLKDVTMKSLPSIASVPENAIIDADSGFSFQRKGNKWVDYRG